MGLACFLFVLTWTLTHARVPFYLKNFDVSPGYKTLWKVAAPKRHPTGIEFNEISRGSLLKIMAEFAQSVDHRHHARKLRPEFTAHFANNQYTKPFIYPQYFKTR